MKLVRAMGAQRNQEVALYVGVCSDLHGVEGVEPDQCLLG